MPDLSRPQPKSSRDTSPHVNRSYRQNDRGTLRSTATSSARLAPSHHPLFDRERRTDPDHPADDSISKAIAKLIRSDLIVIDAAYENARSHADQASTPPGSTS